MTAARYRGFRWPTHPQRLLLQAATADPGKAADAWDEWTRTNNLDHIDLASQQLMPHVAQNLQSLTGAVPELARLKGLQRRAWYENRLAMHAAEQAVAALIAEGIEAMLLKGGALLAAGYPVSPRFMSDVDLLVHADEASRAVALLFRQGWRCPGGHEDAIGVLHAVELRNPAGKAIDLHRSMLEDNPRPAADNGAWARSRRATLGDVAVRVPSSEDLLVGVCVHGLRAVPHPTVRWALDARALVTGDIDWKLVVEVARERECTLAMRHALGFLRSELCVPVPASTLRELRTSRRGWLERLDYQAQGRKDRAGWAVLSTFTRHLRQHGGGGAAIGSIITFPRFLQLLWDVDSAWQVPTTAWARLRAHLSGRHPLRVERR